MTAELIQTEKPVIAELSEDGDRIEIRFKYNPEYVVMAKRIAGYKFVPREKPGGPCWRYPLNINTARRLREVYGDALGLGPKVKQWGHDVVGKERNLVSLSQADDAELEQVSAKFSKWLRPYQRADAKFMAQANVINANQPRTGKTPTMIASVIEAGLEWGQHLVFAPVQALYDPWTLEIQASYAKQGLEEPTVLSGDTPDDRRDAIEAAAAMAEEGLAFWLVLNPDMGRIYRESDGNAESAKQVEKLKYPALAEIEWDTITIDEFHLMGLSNPVTLGAIGVNRIADETQPLRRFAMSGTPMKGKPIKLWGALHFLNPPAFPSRWGWAKHWLVVTKQVHNRDGDSHSNIEGIQPGREMEFYEHLQPYLVRRTQREALPGLPEKQRVNVWCSMTPRQAEQYHKMATEAEWAMEDAEGEGRLSVTNILAMYTRLKQFADAFCDVKRTGKENQMGLPVLEVRQTPDSGKLDQLLERLQEVNVIGTGKDDEDLACALVASQFNPMCDMLAEALRARGVPVAIIKAGKKKANEAIIREFQEQSEGAPRVLVMNTLMGTAITLDRAETVHLLDETWVPDDQEQMEDRATPTTEELMAERSGTGIYYYRTRGTVEEYIQQLVADKAMNNRTILDLRRRMAKAHAAEERQVA